MGVIVEIYKIVPSPWNLIIVILLGAGFLVYTLMSTVKFVPYGEEALLTRWKNVLYRDGRPVYKKPGQPHIMVPWVNNLVVTSTLDKVLDLRTINLQVRQFLQIDVTASVVFEVVDIERVLFGAGNFEARMTSACESRLRSCLMSAQPLEINQELAEVEAGFRLLIVPVSKSLGVRFKELNITNIAYNGQVTIARAIASLGPGSPEVLENLGVSLNGHTPA